MTVLSPLGPPAKLSVVIPCLNAAATLGEQLAALAAQVYDGPWEAIVADNGSTDGSQAVAESFRGRVPELRIVDAADRKGQAHAKNVAARAATGDAFLYCDADDVVAPRWLAALAAALSRNDFVACRYDNERLNPEWTRRTHTNPQSEGISRYDYPPFLPHAGGGGLAVTRRAHEAVGGFDETLPALEDTDYCWRLQLAGFPLQFAPEALVYIRHRHDLGSIYRQGVSYGLHNVLIYQRYRGRGMPRLGVMPGLLRWGKLLLTAPRALSREARGRWLWQLGWRVGRVKGCVRYRVLAP